MADKSTEVNRTLLNDVLACEESQDSDSQGNSGARAGVYMQNAGVEGNSGATAGIDIQNAWTEDSRNAVRNEEILQDRHRHQVNDGPDNVDGATGGHVRRSNMTEDSNNFTTVPEEPTARPDGRGDEAENEMFNRQNVYRHYSVMRSVRDGFQSIPSESNEDSD